MIMIATVDMHIIRGLHIIRKGNEPRIYNEPSNEKRVAVIGVLRQRGSVGGLG